MSNATRLGRLSWQRKIVLYVGLTALGAAGIAFMAFLLVTLRKAFELSSPWEVLGYFVIVIVGLAVLARLSGIHETR